MAEGPTRALTGRRRTKPTSTGCRNPWQPEPGRAPLIATRAPVQTNGTTSLSQAGVLLDQVAGLSEELVRRLAGDLLDGLADLGREAEGCRIALCRVALLESRLPRPGLADLGRSAHQCVEQLPGVEHRSLLAMSGLAKGTTRGPRIGSSAQAAVLARTIPCRPSGGFKDE